MDGEGMCKYTVIMQTSPTARNKDLNNFEKRIKQQSLINIQGWTLDLNWSGVKKK